MGQSSSWPRGDIAPEAVPSLPRHQHSHWAGPFPTARSPPRASGHRSLLRPRPLRHAPVSGTLAGSPGLPSSPPAPLAPPDPTLRGASPHPAVKRTPGRPPTTSAVPSPVARPPSKLCSSRLLHSGRWTRTRDSTPPSPPKAPESLFAGRQFLRAQTPKVCGAPQPQWRCSKLVLFDRSNGPRHPTLTFKPVLVISPLHVF